MLFVKFILSFKYTDFFVLFVCFFIYIIFSLKLCYSITVEKP